MGNMFHLPSHHLLLSENSGEIPTLLYSTLSHCKQANKLINQPKHTLKKKEFQGMSLEGMSDAFYPGGSV